MQIAKELVGKKLYSNINGQVCGGIIVETEAYNGRTDKACHAYLNKNTKRTQIMFGEGGMTYVYICYGIHKMFNIVTNMANLADAVLIRAIEPLAGVNYMEIRRNIKSNKVALTSGPGNLCKAMGIDLMHYGTDLSGNVIWIEENEGKIFEVEARKRVGVDYAGRDKDLPWRFIMKGNKWVSKRNFGL